MKLKVMDNVALVTNSTGKVYHVFPICNIRHVEITEAHHVSPYSSNLTPISKITIELDNQYPIVIKHSDADQAVQMLEKLIVAMRDYHRE